MSRAQVHQLIDLRSDLGNEIGSGSNKIAIQIVAILKRSDCQRIVLYVKTKHLRDPVQHLLNTIEFPDSYKPLNKCLERLKHFASARASIIQFFVEILGRYFHALDFFDNAGYRMMCRLKLLSEI